jgi:iron(III) transport system substrate-binding protein
MLRHPAPSRRWRGLLALLAVAMLAGAGLTGCGRDEDRLVIYSGRFRTVMTPLFEQFAADTGIEVEVRYDTPAHLAERIDEQGADTDADVFISPSADAVAFLDHADRLDPLPDDLAGLVADPADAAADTTSVGFSGRVRTLVYNTDLLEPEDLPDSVFDLVDDELAGQVALAPATASFHDFVTALRQQAGEDEAAAWLAGMADGGPPIFPDNQTMIEAIGRGEVLMGLVNHADPWVIKVDDPAIPVDNHYFPDGDAGSPLLAMTASIVSGTDHPDEAQQLIEWLLSADGEQFLTDQTFEYPLGTGASLPETDEPIPPLDEVAPARVDLAAVDDDLGATARLIDESGLDG